MKRLPLVLVLIAALVVGATPVHAASTPVISGQVSGLELCEQAVCGAAIFVGVFVGRVGNSPVSIGLMSVAVTHDALPLPGETRAITGGAWRLRLLNGKTIAGFVTGGGLSNPNNDGTFGVAVDLLVQQGGTGTLSFNGVLSHNVFPPSINGVLSQ